MQEEPEQLKTERDKFSSWFEEMAKNPDIRDLAKKIAEYEEEYFFDLTLNVFEELCQYDSQTDSISLFGSPRWRFYVVPNEDPELEDANGICYYNKETSDFYIKIRESHKNNKTTILHEMIHAYEDIIEDSNDIAAQLLPICLYDKLYREIPNLKHILFLNANRYYSHIHHRTLFFLKSLDLDLRLGLPLGSVASYGREEYIQGLNEQIKTTGETKTELKFDIPPVSLPPKDGIKPRDPDDCERNDKH